MNMLNILKRYMNDEENVSGKEFLAMANLIVEKPLTRTTLKRFEFVKCINRHKVVFTDNNHLTTTLLKPIDKVWQEFNWWTDIRYNELEGRLIR